MRKPPGSMVDIRMVQWAGPAPEPNDVLQTKTGRRYIVDSVVGKSITATVMAPDEPNPPGAKVFDFYWMWRGRGKKKRGRSPII